MKKILFTASEAYPLMKTGGLGDVVGSLPIALENIGYEVKVLLPAYRDALLKAESLRTIGSIHIDGTGAVSILETTLADSKVKVWLVDYPSYFDRSGNPYHDQHGSEWSDNVDRFTLFCRVAENIALGENQLAWQPDIVHCHDWQTGLVPALLSLHEKRPATFFTIHNLAYQGVFSADNFARLNLPTELWGIEGVEFYGQLSLMKAGLAYSDKLTTVSPSYAQEIQTQEFGYGLDGLLQYRKNDLIGILNGIDQTCWNPATDPYLEMPYHSHDITGKSENKRHLQQSFMLKEDADTPLLIMIGRLAEQKGIDIILEALPSLLELPLQIALLGTGDKYFESALLNLTEQHDNLATLIGYNEKLAHQMEAGGDMFLMPSRFEPCGLNQMYSLRYGTIPIVRPVGGLKDTVIDHKETNSAHKPNGFVIDEYSAVSMLKSVQEAVAAFQNKDGWQKLMANGMEEDFSWERSAQQYASLYEQA